LLASLNVVSCLNDEAFTLITVRPLGLFGSLVVQHVSVGDKAISLYALNRNAEDATADHHSHFTVLPERELAEVRHFSGD